MRGTDREDSAIRIVRTGSDGSYQGRVTLGTVEPVVNPTSCVNDVYYNMPQDAAARNALAILLMAQATGRQVTLDIDNTQCGQYNHPLVRYVWVSST